MRTLVVSDHWPWPECIGANQRMATVVEELLALGEVEFFHIDRQWAEPLPVTENGVLDRATHVALPGEGRLASMARRLRHPLQPADLARLHRRLADELRAWTAGRAYDLVWCTKEVALAPVLGGLPAAPVVLDVDDLYDVTYERWQATKTDLSPLRRRLDDAGSWHLRHMWRRAHVRHAGRVAYAVVCSERDRARIAAPNVVVVHNAYRGEVTSPAPRTGRPPTILFQALFTFFVNEDAARALADRIVPVVRQRVPDVRLLLVGHHGGCLRDLAGRPGVEVTGLVPDMAPWLAKAHVQAVPLRAGSGTRTKILEATANGIPVVATSVGADGLDLVSGEHAHITDDEEEFAHHCAELLLDPHRGVDLATKAQQLLRTRLSIEEMRRRIRHTALRAAGGTA